MRTMIVVNHPYEGSFCRALAHAAERGAQRAGHDVDVLDLDASGFDPVMSRADLGAWRSHTTVDPHVRDFQSRIDAADHLVLVHPVWWETAPALTKGFFDKVLVPGWAYEDGFAGLPRGRFARLQRVTVATTMSTPGSAYRLLFGNTVQKASVRGVWQKMGVRARWLSHPRADAVTPQRREQWLARMEGRVARTRLDDRPARPAPDGPRSDRSRVRETLLHAAHHHEDDRPAA